MSRITEKQIIGLSKAEFTKKQWYLIKSRKTSFRMAMFWIRQNKKLGARTIIP